MHRYRLWCEVARSWDELPANFAIAIYTTDICSSSIEAQQGLKKLSLKSCSYLSYLYMCLIGQFNTQLKSRACVVLA